MSEGAGASRGLRVLPAGILVGGLALASLFQHKTPTKPPVREPQVHFRQQSPPPVAGAAISDLPAPRIESPPAASVFGAVESLSARKLLADDEPLPPLAFSYPRESSTVGKEHSRAIDFPSARRAAPVRTHTIADGDTLPGLARFYLGDASRFMEIYEANRDVLATPDGLPIGANLKIPPSESRLQPGRP